MLRHSGTRASTTAEASRRARLVNHQYAIAVTAAMTRDGNTRRVRMNGMRAASALALASRAAHCHRRRCATSRSNRVTRASGGIGTDHLRQPADRAASHPGLDAKEDECEQPEPAAVTAITRAA